MLIFLFYFQKEDIIPYIEDISIVKVSSNEFEISNLKKKIAKTLKDHDNEADFGGRLCRDLRCKCIASKSDFEYLFSHSDADKNKVVEGDFRKQLENDVSNICITLLNFLMLDEEINMEKNLGLLFEQSMNFLDSQRGPDEIMVDIFYPIYVRFFEPLYSKLKKDQNYSDPFTYDQRVIRPDGTNFFFDDINQNACKIIAKCNETLNGLLSTWKKVRNVMSFDWNMGIGSMISNFNYLMMMCSDIHPLQTNEQMWAPNQEFGGVPCRTNADARALYELIQTITEEIFDLPFGGIYLNDLVGYLGYSSTFDISSLQKDKYMYNTRNLHPIIGMDTYMNEEKLRIEGWRQCNYLGTFQNWVKRTSNLGKTKSIGKCVKNIVVYLLYV